MGVAGSRRLRSGDFRGCPGRVVDEVSRPVAAESPSKPGNSCSSSYLPGIEETILRLDPRHRRPAAANRNFSLRPQPLTRASRLPRPPFSAFLLAMDALTVKLRPSGRYFQANQAPQREQRANRPGCGF
jgi:hypothetical protein